MALRTAGRRLGGFLKVVAGTTAVGSVAFYGYTRKSTLAPMPETDPLFLHPWLVALNPLKNPTFHDCFTRSVPLQDVQPELVDDWRRGGSKLIERFSAGAYGRYAFKPQLRILNSIRKSSSNATDLWTSEELLQSDYSEGTILADDFIVLDKTPTSVLLRGGLSPRVHPGEPRDFDTIIALAVEIDEEKKLVNFYIRGMVFNGAVKGAPHGMPSVMVFLHQQYAKILLKAAVDHCMS